MLLPGFLLGTLAEARRGASRYVREVVDGSETEVALVDTHSISALIVLDDENGFRAHERHFQMHAIFETADSPRYYPIRQRLFERVSQAQWGPLALFNGQVTLLRINRLIPDSASDVAMATAIRYWDVYLAEGSRYATGSTEGGIWEAANGLKAALQLKGVPGQELLAPLPAGGLGALLSRHPDAFRDALALSRRAPSEGG
jgi:hypothetical protein